MSNEKHREWILASIDQLRSRKARPDLNRICHMVRRRFGLSLQEATASLENLVDERIVVKVEYKGHTSYRNAAKWKKSALGGHVLNSNALIQDIQKAVTEICRNNTDGERGANIRDIEKWLLTNGSEDFEKLSTHLEDALSREVENRRLKKLFFNGYYIIAKRPEEKEKPKQKVAPKNAAENMKKLRGRPPSKRMKFKKTHGPDFEMLDPIGGRRSKSNTDKNDEDVCDYCKLDSSKNPKGKPEKLLYCQDCTTKAHSSCLKYSPKLAKKVYKGPWQCFDCKACCVCEDAEDATTMLFCDFCDRGYHMACHRPALKEKSRGTWVCYECDSSVYQNNDMEESSGSEGYCNDNYASFPPTPCDSPMQGDDDKFKYRLLKHQQNSKESVPGQLSKEPKLDGPHYPDATDWTIDDVVQFFLSVGFANEQIEGFREQEIDGKSILLMKRVDVISGLSLKLGPALKLFQHVEGLQTAGFEMD